jgi:8-oxo-dGTP pyrophosphatase MutT (NUDIX family)
MSFSIKKSYGIACCRLNHKTNKPEILLIHKRTTFSFIEFAFGHYKPTDEWRIIYLFNHMTAEEKLDVRSMDFGRWWYRIWLVNPDSIYTPDDLTLTPERYEKYIRCKNYFYKNFQQDRGRRLLGLLSRSNTTDTLWEIPKGRMSFAQERPLNCAVREFREETHITPAEYEIICHEPFINSIQNGKIRYQNYYFMAILHQQSTFHNPFNLQLDYNDAQQISEVIGMQWMDIDKLRVIDPNNHFTYSARAMFKILRKYKKMRYSNI